MENRVYCVPTIQARQEIRETDCAAGVTIIWFDGETKAISSVAEPVYTD